MVGSLGFPVMITTAQVVGRALDRIATNYVFPERVEEIDSAVRKRLDAGDYDTLSGPVLCEVVTADMQRACPDKHLRLLWVDEPQSTDPVDEDDGRAAFLAKSKAENEGVRRFEHLEGNIGYLEVIRIADAGEGAHMIGAAMRLVAHTSALILDLRQCSGGAPTGAAMWCSYFFPDDQVHLNDIYERATDSTRQYWTASHLPAPRYLNRPVYVLTSVDTFSGGEDVAYTLQAHGRALIVGDTTRGGAHPTARYPVSEHITVAVPTGRTINTVTGTNWEGVGVAPDHAVPAEQALEAAHQHALHRAT